MPGCGRGYDVVLLSRYGFDTWGLEITQKAVEAAERYADQESAIGEPQIQENSGIIHFTVGDFFAQDWNPDIPETFDLIYNYTFLCAIHPSLRAKWARRMSHLLTRSGILVCLEFPLYKPLDAAGPPIGLKGVYFDLLVGGGDGQLHKLESQRRGNCLIAGTFEGNCISSPQSRMRLGRIQICLVYGMKSE